MAAGQQPPPLAVNDAAGTAANRPLFVLVTANDRDRMGGGLRIESAGAAAHGTVAVIGRDGRSVIYTPAAGYWGLDSFPYTVVDANGQRDKAVVFVVVAAGEDIPQVQPVADPAVDSTAGFVAATSRLDVRLPGGCFAGTVGEKDVLFLVFLPQDTLEDGGGQPPAGLAFANLAFDLSAFRNDQPLAGQPLEKPLTVTISYDSAALDDLKADTLSLWRWNDSEWSFEGVNIVGRDPVGRTITVALSHLGRFALFAAAPTALEVGEEPAAPAHLYLPVAAR
jgi:hypothetical protein